MKQITQIAVFAMLSALVGLGHAQVDVEPEVVTDSLTFTDTDGGARKSRTIATLTTLLLPGLGHQYLGDEKRAMLYYTTEIISWLGLAFNEGYSRKLLSDSRALAFVHAGVEKVLPGDSSYYWQLLRHYEDWKSYNRDVELNRTPELKYVEDMGLDWEWDDVFYKEQYGQLREKATNFHVVGTFFIAGAVLNRVIAFIDIRIATRHKATSVAGLHLRPSYNPLSEKTALTVSGRF